MHANLNIDDPHLLFLQRGLLPRAGVPARSEEFDGMMRALSALGEHEQRLKALITLTEAQDDPELIALRVLFKNLVANTCSLVSRVTSINSMYCITISFIQFREIYNLDNCSYADLKILKFKIDAYNIASKAFLATQSALNGIDVGAGQQWKDWIANVFVCGLDDEEIALIGHLGWPEPLNKNCCHGN